MFDAVRFVSGVKYTPRGAWPLEKKTSDTTDLILLIHGTLSLTVGEECLTLHENEVLVIPPHTPYGRDEDRSANVSFYWLSLSDLPTDELPPLVSAPRPFSRSVGWAKNTLAYAASRTYRAECADLCARFLLHEMTHATLDLGKGEHELYYVVHEWISANADRPITVADVAEHFNYNADYLNRLFKAYRRLTIKKYIDTARIRYVSADLLRDELTLRQIATKYAFPDYKAFLKYFKYHMGCTPAEYRSSRA